MSTPIRMCIGCRTRNGASALVRITAVGGEVVILRHGGRGAWLCPTIDCLARAVQRQAVARALRAEVSQASLEVLRMSFVQKSSHVGG